MTEVWFYHLERQSLEQVLPVLLDRAMQRKWRAVVQARDPERVAALDDLLWTWSDEAFLAHGTARDGDPDLQPIWLTADVDDPIGADMRIFIDGASPDDILVDPAAAPKQRAVVMFDGRDPQALDVARGQFRSLKEKGHTLSYWRQSPAGRWEQQA